MYMLYIQAEHPPLSVGINLSEERNQSFPSLLHRLPAGQFATINTHRPLCRLSCLRLRPGSEKQHLLPTTGGTGTMLMIRAAGRVLYIYGPTTTGNYERNRPSQEHKKERCDNKLPA